MHFIIKINIDENGLFVSNSIMSHNNSIAAAQNLLTQSVKKYLEQEHGLAAANNMKIIDIHSFDQISEPIIDSILVYRLESDPHHLHLYQKQSKIVPGRVYGQTVASEFIKIMIFGLVEYAGINTESSSSKKSENTRPEMISHGPAQIQIPKAITISPMADLISSLKVSPQFLKRYDESDQLQSLRKVSSTQKNKILTTSLVTIDETIVEKITETKSEVLVSEVLVLEIPEIPEIPEVLVLEIPEVSVPEIPEVLVLEIPEVLVLEIPEITEITEVLEDIMPNIIDMVTMNIIE